MDEEIIIIIDPKTQQALFFPKTVAGLSAAIDYLENRRKELANEPRDGS